MDGEPQKLTDKTIAESTESQAGIVATDAPSVAEPATVGHAVNKPGRLKQVAWRGTAGAYWIWRIARFSLGAELMNSVASTIVARFSVFLSAVGFAPVHSEYLGRILRAGWLLVLAGFRPLDLIGLVIYINIAPFTFLGYLIFRDYSKDFAKTPTVKRGLRTPKMRRPALTAVGLLLLGWFVLYGEASARRALVVGAVLSWLLFLILAGRAFQKVKPPEYPNGSEVAGFGEKFGLSLLTSATDSLTKATSAKKKSEVTGSVFVYRTARYVWTRMAQFMRGQTARNRLYLLLLADYVVSLLLLGGAAVFSWAITGKVTLAPTTVPLATFVRACSSYFLPNLRSPSLAPDLPSWVGVGCSITAFILFVLFVGAAASLLPSRFTVYTDRLNKKYRITRKFAVTFKRTAKALERAKLSKPVG